MSNSVWHGFVVGDRVVVRSRLNLVAEDPDAKCFSDVIGIVVGLSEAGFKLRRDAAGYPDSNEVFIPAGDIVTAKTIPPRPIRGQRS